MGLLPGFLMELLHRPILWSIAIRGRRHRSPLVGVVEVGRGLAGTDLLVEDREAPGWRYTQEDRPSPAARSPQQPLCRRVLPTHPFLRRCRARARARPPRRLPRR